MTSAKINVSQLTLYNPARMKDAEIVAAFVARKAVFERLIADIAAEKPGSRAQHHLIVGQRGMGKSTLLARLSAELRTSTELSKRFVPLVFAEEQYAVDRMSKFWLNCLDSLADAAERAGDTATSAKIDAIVRTLKPQSGGTGEKDGSSARAAMEAFLKAAESGGKRPVLLVDNLQLVFERIAEIEQHALRELLMQPGSPILVGASPSPPPESQDYTAAFYDHFKINYLRPLSADEMRDLMLKLAETTDRTDVRDKVLAHPQRLQTLRELTGGNPRTVVTLFFLYAEDFSPSVFADLENLLDRVTPLYKARIEELPEQQQVIVSAVADHWAPITARNLADATALPMASISAQLDRLERTGVVEKVEIFGKSSAGYQIAERFFNVWFLMRSASRRQRREVEFLVRFIESFYDAKDRPRLAHDLLKESCFSPDRFQFAKALAYTLDPNDKEELDRHAELDALRQKAADARRKLEEVIDFSQLPPATLAFDELREKLIALVPADAGLAPEQFAEDVLGDRQMFIRNEREKLAQTDGKLSKEKIDAIRESIIGAREGEELHYGDAATWFRHRLASGQLRARDNLEDWNRSFLRADGTSIVQLLLDSLPSNIGRKLTPEAQSLIRKFLAPKSASPIHAWLNWGNILHALLGFDSEAEAAFRKAIDIYPNHAVGWRALGDFLETDEGRAGDAEAAFRKAIELNPRDLYAWTSLADLLENRLSRFEEAEAAYRQAIQISRQNAYASTRLGYLLWNRFGRFDEAEARIRKAIEASPRYAFAWAILGFLLSSRHGRFEDAEAAFRKAITLNPQQSSTWVGLADLLQIHLCRYSEAEIAYRKAIELNPRDPATWNNLGNLLNRHLNRFDEAENAYRKAIELDPRHSYPWNGLGDLLKRHLGRYESAESAYQKAIELDSRYAVPWNGLGNLYCDYLARYSDAAAAFAKAIEVDGGNLSTRHNLVFLLRDYIGDPQAAIHAFEPLRAQSTNVFEDSFRLQEALFAAYDANWGLCAKALASAIETITDHFRPDTQDDWFRASAVLLHLNYGEQLLAFLRERGDDARLRPWYEALSALNRGDRRYLQNIPVEARTTAEYYFDQIEKRLDALPEKTRRRPVPKSGKKRRTD